jgi:hypothetical protein
LECASSTCSRKWRVCTFIIGTSQPRAAATKTCGTKAKPRRTSWPHDAERHVASRCAGGGRNAEIRVRRTTRSPPEHSIPQSGRPTCLCAPPGGPACQHPFPDARTESACGSGVRPPRARIPSGPRVNASKYIGQEAIGEQNTCSGGAWAPGGATYFRSSTWSSRSWSATAAACCGGMPHAFYAHGADMAWVSSADGAQTESNQHSTGEAANRSTTLEHAQADRHVNCTWRHNTWQHTRGQSAAAAVDNVGAPAFLPVCGILAYREHG